MFFKLASLSGLIASIWIVASVTIAGYLYGGYSHARQLCSELGAAGSPTEKISPFINNYPLGILFCIFGFFLIKHNVSLHVVVVGWLVVLHGVGTLIAGYYPMDADPYTKKPTRECEFHTLAGVLMLFTLFLAPVVLLFSDISLNFKLFTIICLLLFLGFMAKMVLEYKNRGRIGLYQRLSYGAQLLWLGGFSLVAS